MKKFFALMATALLAMTTQAADFKQGEDYTVLDTEKTATPTVTEYFSFYCPHCEKFEPLVIEKLKKTIPDNAKLQKVHVSFMGGNMGIPMAKAYATMIVLKAEEIMVPYMFKQIHQLGAAPKNELMLRQMFIDNGIDSKKFDAAYNSFAVDSMQKRFDKQFAAVGLRGVPGIVVNNKYVVTNTNLNEYFDLVNYLLKL
jgi:thiol:disulfide interchange protein DsbA